MQSVGLGARCWYVLGDVVVVLDGAPGQHLARFGAIHTHARHFSFTQEI